MAVQSTTVTRVGSPDAFEALVNGLKAEMNAILSTLAINNVLDVRYDYGQFSNPNVRVFAVGTILYLE